jgi:hypothetical protein
MHLLIRVIRRRVLYHRDLVAKLSGEANSCLHARVCYEPDDDELMDAVLLELQIQIGVGKATGTPMLEGHDVARLWCEFGPYSPPHRAIWAVRALATSVLVGMQPVLTQVPPNRLRSTIAVFIPAPVSRPASDGPACPVPMIIAS